MSFDFNNSVIPFPTSAYVSYTNAFKPEVKKLIIDGEEVSTLSIIKDALRTSIDTIEKARAKAHASFPKLFN